MATEPTLQFSDAAYHIHKNEANASIGLTRIGDNTGNATVLYALKKGTASDSTKRILTTGTLSFALGETQKTVPVSIPANFTESSVPLHLELSNPTGAQLGDPHEATLSISSAGWSMGPAWSQVWRVFSHVALALLSISVICGISWAVLETAKGWSRDWRKYLVPQQDQQLTFTEGTQITAAEQGRLKDQLERTRQRSRLHLDVMTFYYIRYYMSIIMLLLVASLAAITLVLISKRGWERTNEYIITTFFLMTAASMCFGSWPKVFRQEQNITDNKVFYLKYTSLENEILSYAATNEALNHMITSDELKKSLILSSTATLAPGESQGPIPKPADSQTQVTRAGIPLSAKDFIHYIDLQLAQSNIAIGFDYTQVPTYKNAFDTK
jgi:Calx-beta domain